MASTSAQPATNAQIVRMLEQVRAQLAKAEQRDERIARDLGRLLARQ
jgi:hypothetical protein